MNTGGRNTPFFRVVISRGYIDALLERSRVIMAQAADVIRQAEAVLSETRNTPGASTQDKPKTGIKGPKATPLKIRFISENITLRK